MLHQSVRNDTADGEHTKTAEELCEAGVHRDVVLTPYSNVKIVNHDRVYQSLINNLDARLTASPDIRELLDDIHVVGPSKWPSTVESPWLEGEAKVKNYVNVLI